MIVLLVIGLIALIKGADFFVDGASSLAKCFSVSDIVIGLTVVAFGTSMPEMMVSVFSSIQGHNEIAFGNVIGSNVFNILVILGIAGMMNPISIHKTTVRWEIPFSLAAVLILFVLVNDKLMFGAEKDQLSFMDAGILLILFAAFFFYSFILRSVQSNGESPVEQCATKKTILLIVIGLIGLFVGAKLVVDNAVKIAIELNISEKLIALTLIAGGTSLPELATSAVAAFKKRLDIAVGNVIGSNIFNILLILGVSSSIKPIPFDTTLNYDLGILTLATLVLLFSMVTGKRKKLDRWEALLLLIGYFVYLIYLIIRK